MHSKTNTETSVLGDGERSHSSWPRQEGGSMDSLKPTLSRAKGRVFYIAKGLGKRSFGETKGSLQISPGQSATATGGWPSGDCNLPEGILFLLQNKFTNPGD